MEFTTLAEGLDHPEGAAVGPDGTVYAGGEAGQIYRIAADGTPEQYADTGGVLFGGAGGGGGDADGLGPGGGGGVRGGPKGGGGGGFPGARRKPPRAPHLSPVWAR